MPPVTFRNPFERTSQPPHTVAVIPARYHSTRFPGKPLADLAGRPMIEHVYTRAAAAPGVDAVVVATDDARIEEAVRTFGGIVRMTSGDHRTGLDRIAEVAADLSCEIVVNVQGDEPLIDPEAITEVIAPFARDPGLQMATLRRRITDPGDIDNPHVVKVVVDPRDRALYFSRATIPFTPEPPEGGPHETGVVGTGDRVVVRTGDTGGVRAGDTGGVRAGDTAVVGAGFSRLVYKHIGIYAYRRAFVRALAALPQTPLELAESLEQLRALEHGFQICALETHCDSISVDTPEDLERVRRQMTVGTRA